MASPSPRLCECCMSPSRFTEVGHRFGAEIRVSRMFKLFASHYGLDCSFTNPYSGNEKGNCENIVGAHGRALFVPVPSFHDVARFNERLLKDSLDLSDKRHYRLGVPQLELFEDDREALLPLPAVPFCCVRWEERTLRANKQDEVVKIHFRYRFDVHFEPGVVMNPQQKALNVSHHAHRPRRT